MAGRPPKPSILKLLAGNPGKRKLPENEPKPPAGKPMPPDWLSAEARKLWAREAPHYEAMKTLTVVDAAVFGVFMELLAKVAISAREGLPVSNETANAIRNYAVQFGATPSGRARIAMPKDDEKESKLSRFTGASKKA